MLTTSPWLVRWWVAHLGLLVCAVCLVVGIGAERARRGDLAGVALLDLLPRLADHVLDATSDGIAVRDQTGRLVGWNPAAVALTGWSRDEAEDRFHPDRQGLLDLDAGRWIDVRCEQIRRYGAHYTVTVFRDARAEMELRVRQAELAAFCPSPGPPGPRRTPNPRPPSAGPAAAATACRSTLRRVPVHRPGRTGTR